MDGLKKLFNTSSDFSRLLKVCLNEYEVFFDDGFAKVFDVFAKFLHDDGADFVFEMIDLVVTIDSVQKSSKLGSSSRFFGRLKFSAVFGCFLAGFSVVFWLVFARFFSVRWLRQKNQQPKLHNNFTTQSSRRTISFISPRSKGNKTKHWKV